MFKCLHVVCLFPLFTVIPQHILTCAMLYSFTLKYDVFRALAKFDVHVPLSRFLLMLPVRNSLEGCCPGVHRLSRLRG